MKLTQYYSPVILVAVAGILGTAGAETLQVGSTEGLPGDVVTVPITVDIPGNTAGAAFTVTYDDAALTLTGVSSTFFDTFTRQSTNLPVSVEVEGTVYDQPLLATTGSAGAMIAAARVSDGSAEPTMFNLEFNIAPDAPAQDYSVDIVPTSLDNVEAGYAAAGEIVPLLVGYTPGSTPSYPVIAPTVVGGMVSVLSPDADGDGMTDEWEITYFGSTDVSDGTGDYDRDGYSDYEEFLKDGTNDLNGRPYDPTVRNTPGDSGYDPASDSRVTLDFNRDGMTDMLWRHVNGYTTAWLMNDTTETWNGFGVMHYSFVIRELGDFSGDGRTDILWRHPSSGDTKLWLTYGSGKTQVDLGIVDTSFSILGVGDFNGDGREDILWRHSGGFTTSWQMDGGSYTQVDYGTISSDYQFLGLADFNGDGRTDILWRHRGGYAVIWELDGAAKTQIGLGTISTDYSFQGTGDFNGDGRDEIVWRHTGGFTTIWRIDGATKSWIGLGTIDPAYSFLGIGDFNGDNKDEILWRHTGGFTTIWRIESDTQKSWVGLGTIDPAYRFKDIGDYNGDGSEEILWRHTNGFTTIWRVIGTTRSWLNIGDISVDYTYQPPE